MNLAYLPDSIACLTPCDLHAYAPWVVGLDFLSIRYFDCRTHCDNHRDRKKIMSSKEEVPLDSASSKVTARAVAWRILSARQSTRGET